MLSDVFISYDLEYVIKKATTRTTIGLIKAKSCNVLLCMLLGCIRRYLKSFLRCKIFNFGYLPSGQPIPSGRAV